MQTGFEEFVETTKDCRGNLDQLAMQQKQLEIETRVNRSVDKLGQDPKAEKKERAEKKEGEEGEDGAEGDDGEEGAEGAEGAEGGDKGAGEGRQLERFSCPLSFGILIFVRML